MDDRTTVDVTQDGVTHVQPPLGVVQEFLVEIGYASLVEQFTEEERPEQRAELPHGFKEPFYKKILEEIGIAVGTVWCHQAEALEAISAGLSAVLSTGTASGKSLIFQLATIFKLKSKKDNATALAVYTTRALVNDQKESWEKVMTAAGYPEGSVAMIDGDVPTEERMRILETAKVVLATPDVIHAWMLPNRDKEPIRRFLSKLVIKTYDEGHLYEGDFGTRMAGLHQRIEFAQRTENKRFKPGDHDQTIIASATLDNPKRFAEQLTGQDDFWVIDKDYDTSPRYKRHFKVLRVPNGRVRWAITQFLAFVARKGHKGTIMTFVGSRQGADNMTRDVNRILGKNAFVAYRGGQTKEDRIQTEHELHDSAIEGVVTTSALESGVNIKSVGTVVMAGIPETSSLAQQSGRLRHQGDVLLFATQDELAAMRETVGERYRAKPARIQLYKKSPKILASEAVCLIEEMEVMGKVSVEVLTQSGVNFSKALLDNVRDFIEKPYHALTPIQRAAIPPEGISAHHFHSMRSSDGPTRDIHTFNAKTGRIQTLGEVTQLQFLREALPGMIMLLGRRLYKVKECVEKIGGRILVRPLSREEFLENPKTRALITTQAHTALNALHVHRYRSQNGMRDAIRMKDVKNFIADCKINILFTAEGFIERKKGSRSTHYMFKPERKEPYIDQQQRRDVIETAEFGPPRQAKLDTTGVVISIGEDILTKGQLRKLAELMTTALCHQFNISPHDVGFLVNASTVTVTPRTTVNDRSIVIYDRTPGGLNLSSNVFFKMGKLIEGMMDIAQQSQNEESWHIIQTFMDWVDSKEMKPRVVPDYDSWSLKGLKKPANDNHREVFLPDSEVYWNKDGDKHWVKILGAEIIHGQFFYSVQDTGKEQNPYRLVVGDGEPKRPTRRNQVIFVKPEELERPRAPTYQLGYFNVRRNTYDADTRETVVIKRAIPDNVRQMSRVFALS